MSRKNAREDAFRLIFEGLINKYDTGERIDRYFSALNYPAENEGAFINTPKGGDNEYVRTVLTGVFENAPRLDEIISSCLKGWSFERISKVSIAAMRLALFEMMYLDDVPIGFLNEGRGYCKTVRRGAIGVICKWCSILGG